MNLPNVAIITGDELRHKYFASSLAQHLNVVVALYEKKANMHEKYDYKPHEKQVVTNHFKARGKSEKAYFSVTPGGIIKEELHLLKGEANSDSVVNKLKELQLDALILFGSSIIKEPLLEFYRDRVINMHLGLSPYYRGSGTNFWPLVDKLPECVGTTIHLATLEVDAGGILKQVRPLMEPDDTIHDVGNKTILEGIKVMPNVVKQYLGGQITPKQQDLSVGTVCLRKDLTSESITVVYENFAQGMLRDYLKNKEQRNNAYPII